MENSLYKIMLTMAVYFIYPETANVKLEDMNALFGDATSQMPTPTSRAETGSLYGASSPVPSINLGQHGADSAIPGLDIEPPHVDIEDGKPVLSRSNSQKGEGVGGWISKLVNRTKSSDKDGVGRGPRYARLDGDD